MRSHNVTQFFAYGKLTHKVYLLLVFIIYLFISLYSLFITAKVTMLTPQWKAQGVAWFTETCYLPCLRDRHNVKSRGVENPIVLARPEPVCPITLPFTVNFLYHSSVVYLLVSFGILRLKVLSNEPSLLSLSLGCRLCQFCNKQKQWIIK
jgi:hypothetical protein